MSEPTTASPDVPSPPAAAAPPSPLPTTTSPPVQTPPITDAPGDPKVATLRGMFPDFDDTLLQSVLESVGGNQDRAVDALLGMSDPEYKSEAPAPQAERPMNQEELDEQLARRLLLEDEQQQHHQWQAQSWNQPPAPVLTRRASQGPPEKDTMAEIGEQFSKIAETGKRTFGSIFNKVKAKMAEMDQSRAAGSSSQQQQQQQPWGVGGDTYPYDQGHAPGSQQQASYDTNPPPPVSSSRPSTASSPIRGYDLSPSASTEPTATPRPSSTGQGQPIDGGKLGLLPKRPVSLLRTSTDEPNQHKKVDNEDLEYVENPFEDGRK